jgi:hypothetical protein
VFHDVSADVEEVTLVLNGDKRALCTIVLRYLKRLREGAKRLDVSLNAEVTKDEKPGTHRRLSKSRAAGDEEGNAELGLDSVAEQVNHLDVEVRDIEVACCAELGLVLRGPCGLRFRGCVRRLNAMTE